MDNENFSEQGNYIEQGDYVEQDKHVEQESYIQQGGYLEQESHAISDVYMESARWNPKRTATRIGLALFIMAASITLFQVAISYLVKTYAPNVFTSSWFQWALVATSMYGIGLPVFFLMTKSLPDGAKRPKEKLKIYQFIIIFFIAVATMYITNFFSVILNFILMLFKGSDILNPIVDAVFDGNMLITFIYTAIGAPIVEELIFRKLMLDKLRRFGDLTAILVTAIAFGLFHMNLAQIFYATALGIIFAYVTVRTNTIRYSVLLHIIINTIGATIAPLALMNENILMIILLFFWVITSIVVGLVLFIIFVVVKKKLVLEKGEEFVPKKSVFLLNPGSLLFIAICLVSVIMVVLS